MLTLSNPGLHGPPTRTHGAQVYCTSSPADRQHREPTTGSERHPHGIDCCAAVNGYDKPQEWPFCDHQDHGSIATRSSPPSFSVESFSPRIPILGLAQTSAC
jgi:hypothetical protein